MESDDLISYNLIESIPKLYDAIFSFLDVKSLCNCSLVCKSWYSFIASSSFLMKKFHFKIYLKDIQNAQETCDIIRNSSRKLFHLNISYENDLKGRIRGFWDPEKGVLPCPVVEHFQLNSLVLKNLTSLNITSAEVSEITNIIKACGNLRHLSIQSMRWTEADWMDIAHAATCKLKTFNISSDSVTVSCHEGLHHFLKTQTDCESFTINRGVLDSKSLIAVMQMKKLKHWEIRDAVCGSFDVSGNLQSLEVLEAFDESDLLDKVAFVKSIPNLKKLSLRNLNQHKVESIGLNLKNLKELHVKSLDFNDISNPELFSSLEIVKIEKFVDFFLQEAILQQVADGPTHFTMKLYDEICKPPHIIWE